MVTLRKRTRTLETPGNQEGISINEEETQKEKKKTIKAKEKEKEKKKEEEISRYEQCREMRIKENKERMQKLMDLSLKLKSETLPSFSSSSKPSSKKPSGRKISSSSSLPTRRSSRLEKATPVSYAEKRVHNKKKQVVVDIESLVEEGGKPEIYSEEHDKLLGTCKSDWTLYVDGYGSDGKRIYDPENGVSCHQCRQKTLGSHTHCSKCKLGQGQFCGDCLFTRYGENVLEANKNWIWICPTCRGICNCSRCRKAKGWAPTGNLYRKVTSLGFKSVAHFLIQTRHSKEESGTQSTN